MTIISELSPLIFAFVGVSVAVGGVFYKAAAMYTFLDVFSDEKNEN